MAEETTPTEKTQLKTKVIKAMGGKPNGTGDTWVFTTGQLKKLGWAVGLIISFAFIYGGRLDRYAKLPEDVRCLAENQAKALAEHELLRKEDALLQERTDNIQQNLKDLLVDVRFIREQLERRK